MSLEIRLGLRENLGQFALLEAAKHGSSRRDPTGVDVIGTSDGETN
jgi:hypothetical protein